MPHMVDHARPHDLWTGVERSAVAASTAVGQASAAARTTAQVAASPRSRSHRGSQPSCSRIAVESRYWRSISPCGVPWPCTSGSTLAARHRDQRAHHVDHRDRLAPAGVPRAPAQLAAGRARRRRPGRRRPRPRRRGSRAPGVPSERITGRSPRASARALSGTIRDQLRSPGPYTFASRVTATRQLVGVRVGARDQVRARLRDVVGIARLQREVLAVGQLVVVAVGLVRRGDHHADSHAVPRPRQASSSV